jgi:predicted permease
MVWDQHPDLYVPITMQPVILPEWSYLNDHRSYWLNIVGRLRPDQTPQQALASLSPLWLSLRSSEFTLLHDQSAKSREGFISRSNLNLDSGAKGFSPYRDDLRMPLLIMMGMVLLVMAMAVVNIASLLLVRAATRVREFSMRFALGATHGQIFRQLLAEGLLLGICSAALGLIIAPQALRALIAWMAGRNSDSAFSAALDWRVLLFTAAAALTASLLFSLAPALQFWNPCLVESLKQQAGTGSGAALQFRRTCVALQIGLSLLLIVGAGVFVRTIQNLRNVNPGFATDHLLTFGLRPEHAGYPPSQIAPVEQRALEALAGLPGVRSAGATNDADLAGMGIDGDVKVSGYTSNEDYTVELPWVSDNYLQTLGIPLVAGRYFSTADSATATKVIIVNESFARHYFGSAQNALGHHVSRPQRPETDSMIVGVVHDAKHVSVRDPAIATAYRPFVQGEKPVGLAFYVRTWQPPDSAAGSIRAAIANIDSKLIVNDLTT